MNNWLNDISDGKRVTLNQLRIRGIGKNTPAQRSRWQRLVQEMSFQPSALPPAALLLVRQIHLDLSSRRERRQGSFYKDNKALSEQLEMCARHAARPRQGRLPSSAKAVLFTDTAELLACLALDAAEGSAARRWWWQALLRVNYSLSIPAVLPLLMEHAHFVPAALQHLHAWQKTTAVVRQISASAASVLLQALWQAFELPQPGSPVPALVSAQKQAAQQQSDSPPLSKRREAEPAFWEEYLPDVSFKPLQQKEQKTLLGIALLLHRTPWVLQQPGFLTLYTRWVTASQVSEPEVEKSLQQPPFEDDIVSPTDLRQPPDSPSLKIDQHDSEQPVVVKDDSPAASSPNTVKIAATSESKSIQKARQRKKTTLPFESETAAGDQGGSTTSEERVARQSTRENEAAQTMANLSDLCAMTSLGGVLFLIPILQRLRLFAVESHPFAVMHELSGWAWLELIASALLGDSATDLERDPMWKSLAELDGRSPEEPCGAFFRGADEYLMPDDWLADASSLKDNWLWHFGKSRLRVLHPAGFFAADLFIANKKAPPRLRALKQLWQLDATRIRPASRKERQICEQLQPGTANPALDRLLQFVVPYLRWRLCVALNIDISDCSTLSRKLLRRTGEFFVTKTHVDLMMPIDAAEISVRLAGLDCSPGWVPALSRVVTFHYT